jgi:hypothetical protein
MDSRNGLLKMFVDLMSQKSFLCKEQRHIRGGEVELHSFTTSARLVASRSSPFIPEERGPVPIKYDAVGRQPV